MTNVTEDNRHDVQLSIGAASKRTDVSIDTLRYYERAGLLPAVARSSSGQRVYSLDDCGWIVFIRRLRATAMPVNEIAEYTSLVRNDDGTAAQRREVLVRHRERIREARAELNGALAILDRKIEHYEAAELGIDLDCSEQPVTTIRLAER